MVETSSSSESKSPSWFSSSSARTLLTDSWSRWSSPFVDRLLQDGKRKKGNDVATRLPINKQENPRGSVGFGVSLEDVGAEHGGQGTGVPALLLECRHTGQEATQEAQEAVVQLGKLLQEVLEVSTQLLVIAVIWGISTGGKVTKKSQAGPFKPQSTNKNKQNRTEKVLLCSAGTFSTLCEVR